LPFRSDRACSPLIITAVPGRKYCIAIGDREIEKFIIRQPPIVEKDDYDSENSWISDGLPSSSRSRRRGDGRGEGGEWRE